MKLRIAVGVSTNGKTVTVADSRAADTRLAQMLCDEFYGDIACIYFVTVDIGEIKPPTPENKP